MEVILYHTNSDYRTLKKVLTDEKRIDVNINNSLSFKELMLKLHFTSEFIYNYCYIPLFNKYYFVESCEYIGRELYSVYLKIDVLMTYCDEILSSSATCTYAPLEFTEPYFSTSDYQVSSKIFTRSFDFENNFNESGINILIGVREGGNT